MKKVLNNKRLNKLMTLLLIVAVLCTTLFGNVMDASAHGGPPPPPPVFSISVDNATLDVGQSTTISTMNAPWNADGIDYSSASSAIASTSGTTVTAMSPGTVRITATAWEWVWVGGKWGHNEKQTLKVATCDVTVNEVVVPITGVTMDPTSINLTNGVSSNLVATVLPANTTYDNAVSWSSSDDGVATVVNGTVTAVGSGTATITAMSVGDNSKKATCTVTVANPVESVTLSKTSTSIVKGLNDTITVSVNPTYADDAAISWSSDNAGVATVLDGVITAEGKGTATITASTANGVSANCVVTVTVPTEGVSLNEVTMTVDINTSKALVATVLPVDADNQVVTWKSSNSYIAQVDQSGNVTGKWPGTADITATASNGTTATCTVTVVKPVTSVKIDDKLFLNKSDTKKLGVAVGPHYATNKKVLWTTDNEAVATVDQYGKVTAVGGGTANITATSESNPSVSDTCKVTVTVPTTGISVNEATATMETGTTKTFSYSVLPLDATNKEVTWSSSDNKVATVDNNGLVTAIKKGTATIKIISKADNKIKATIDITVTSKIVTAKFYILKAGFDFPGLRYGWGNRELLSGDKSVGNDSNNFNFVGSGTFNYDFEPDKTFAEDYSKNHYDNTKIEEVISVPSMNGQYDYDLAGYHYSITSVDWYVVKELGDGWHVDGKATWTSTPIDYNVNYQVLSVSSNQLEQVASETRTVEAVKTLQTGGQLNLSKEGSYFDGWYSEPEFINPISSIPTTTTSDTTVYGRWIAKTTISVNATPGTTTYNGTSQSYSSSEFTGVPSGLTIEGLTSIATGQNAGTYTTSTNASTAVVMDGDLNVTERYIVSVTEATFTINQALLTVTALPDSRMFGEANPTFEVTIAGVVSSDINFLTVADFIATSIATESSNVGNYPIVPSLKADVSGDKYDNYEFDFQEGNLKVRKAVTNKLTVSNKTVVYNGTLQQVFAATSVIEGSKIEYRMTDRYGRGYGNWSETLPSFKDVGTYKVLVRSSKANYKSDESFETITITKAKITVKANNVTVFYNQNPTLTVKVDGIVKADKGLSASDFKAKIYGDYKNPGTYRDVIYSSFVHEKERMYRNYDVEFKKGDLTIIKAPWYWNLGTVKDLTFTYDGNEKEAFTATAKEGSTIYYSTNGYSWSENIPKFTDAGRYYVLVKVTHIGYQTSYSAESLIINKSEANGISANNVEVTYNGKAKQFTADATVSGSTVYYNTTFKDGKPSRKGWTTTAPSFTNAGSYPVAVRVEKKNYVTKEGNYTVTIIPAKVIITIDDKSKIIDSSDPTFTGSKVVTNAADFDADKFNTEFGTVTYGRIAAHQYWNTAGDNVKLTAYYSPNANYVVTVLGGTLRINAKPEAPTPPPAPTPVNPVVVTPTPVVPAQVTTITVTPVVRRTTRNAAAQVVETPEVEEAEEVEDVIIEDEPVAEVSEPVISEEKEDADTALTAIEDEDTAKAVLESDCWIHWLILLLTALYSAYAIVRAYIRNKRIKELEDNAEEVNA